VVTSPKGHWSEGSVQMVTELTDPNPKPNVDLRNKETLNSFPYVQYITQ